MFTRVAQSMRWDQFHISKSLLEQAGITVLDPDASAHVSIAGGNRGYDLLVPDEDADEALRLLQNHQRSDGNQPIG